MSERRHDLDLYASDAEYVALVGTLVAEGLEKGETCVVIATKPHRDALARWLRKKGVAPRFVSRDAARTLARFSVAGMPDRARFNRVLSEVLGAAKARGHRPVRVFGEMVALLIASEGPEAAHCLERLWNTALARRSFSLLCSYPLQAFRRDRPALSSVCAEHGAICA